MSTAPDNSPRTARRSRPWKLATVVGGLLLLGTAALVAWRGTSPPAGTDEQQDEQQQDEQAQRRKDLDPRIGGLVVLPGDDQQQRPSVKPGHWTTASQEMRAMYEDFVGQMHLGVFDRRDGRQEPIGIQHTPFVLRSSRPVALSKGRPKDIETTFFVPQVDQPTQVQTELVERGFGRQFRVPNPVVRMPSYQYYFVVLAREPGRYAFLKSLDSVKVPFDGESDFDETTDPLHYRVVLHAPQRSIPLADNPLTWTSTAYILWDGIDPALFTPDQQRALVDWLHWGGQLIVNGPDSLDLLQGSFLEPFLPASGGGSRTIAAGDPALEALHRGWHIAGDRRPGQPLAPETAWSGIVLDRQPQGSWLPDTGKLLVERRLGRGRIVVSAMQLAQRELVNWRSGFQSWFNATILRRPPRRYVPGHFGGATLAWRDRDLAERRLDARLTSGLRYMARDAGVETSYRYVEVEDPYAGATQAETVRRYRPPQHAGGIGAWNDLSTTANAARDALTQAAGVEVPGTAFVVLWLAAYLLVLVPLNWAIFQAIGRLEWAWIAAPLIAIVATLVVIRQAQLDIGFVRARTEIGLLELQPDYDRGHLSRFTALYTSLATTYDLQYDNATTLAAPFPSTREPRGPRNRSRTVCDFRRYDDVQLAGVFIASNTTSMIHSEQMVALDGAIRLGRSSVRDRPQVENRSQFDLSSVAVVQRPRDPRAPLRGTWIGQLRSGESAPLGGLGPVAAKAPFADERRAELRLSRVERLDLEPTFRLALDAENIEPGEKRLVARLDQVLPGQSVSPTASQVRGATLVVAHLEYQPLPAPRPDANIAADLGQPPADSDRP